MLAEGIFASLQSKSFRQQSTVINRKSSKDAVISNRHDINYTNTDESCFFLLPTH